MDIEGLYAIIHSHVRQAILDSDGVAKLAERGELVVQVRYETERTVVQHIHPAVGVHNHQCLLGLEPADASDVCCVHAILIAVGADLFRLCVHREQCAGRNGEHYSVSFCDLINTVVGEVGSPRLCTHAKREEE